MAQIFNKRCSMLTSDFLKLQGAAFRMLGFDIFTPGRCWRHPFMAIGGVLTLASFMPFTLGYGIKYKDSVDSMTAMLASLLVDVLAIYKFAVIIEVHEEFAKLIYKIRQLLNAECHKNSIYADIIAKENAQEQRISSLYKNCFLCGGLLATFLPLVRMLRSYLRTGITEPSFPYPSVYPWDNHRVHYYLLSYSWNICASMVVIFSSVCVDTLFCSLAHNSCALYKIAQYKLLNFRAKSSNETQSNLHEVFHLYQNTLLFGEELKRVFRPIVCTQFLISSLHLGLLTYQLSANIRRPEALFYVSFIASMMVQLFIYCYCGQCILSESTYFARSITDCPWYEVSSVGMGRSLTFSLMRAQRGIHIDGYFFEANMGTFASIVQKAVSYVTLLRSFS